MYAIRSYYADGCPRVDLDPRQETGNMGQQPGGKPHVPFPEPVRGAVEPDGVKSRVAEQDFQNALGGRVPLEDDLDFVPDPVKHRNSPLFEKIAIT